jgi:hypothetical protein
LFLQEVTKNKKITPYVPEKSIGRYFFANPDDIETLDTGERVVLRSKMHKLRSKDAWRTQFGRLVKVIT